MSINVVGTASKIKAGVAYRTASGPFQGQVVHVRIPEHVIAEAGIEGGAEGIPRFALVTMECKARDCGDYVQYTATKITKVVAPMESETVFGVVKFYDVNKKFGWVALTGGLLDYDARINQATCDKAGLEPGEGRVIRARVRDKGYRLEVTSFEWGPQVTAEYEALQAGAEESATPEGVAETETAKPATLTVVQSTSDEDGDTDDQAQVA